MNRKITIKNYHEDEQRWITIKIMDNDNLARTRKIVASANKNATITKIVANEYAGGYTPLRLATIVK